MTKTPTLEEAVRDALAAQSQGREELRERVLHLVGEASAKAWFAGGACVKDPEDTTHVAQSDEKDAQVTDAIMSLLPRSLPVEASEESREALFGLKLVDGAIIDQVLSDVQHPVAKDVDPDYAEHIMWAIQRAVDARPVKAKALEWDGQLIDGEVASAEPYIGPRYAILANDDGTFCVRTGSGAGYFDGSRRHKTLEAAKASCEAQWQRSILSQLAEGS